MTRVLFAASEVMPLAKTGGLADIAASLPPALLALGVDVRVVMPAYRGCLAKLESSELIGELTIRELGFKVWQGCVPGSITTLWLLDCPALFDREGDPYHDAHFQPWPDNPLRFACFCEAIVQLAHGSGNGGWKADVVHCNDWQTGLVPALLAKHTPRVRTVFTIHNLAYAGCFDRIAFDALQLPPAWWSVDGVEFHGQFSFLKAGLVYSDLVTTVSPTYAREIQTPEFGSGFDGLLRHIAPKLSGILNGIDADVWNPATDPLLAKTYTQRTVKAGKRVNRQALQAELGLELDDGALLIGMVGRLADQKGTDLVLAALPELLTLPIQIAMLASGDKVQEAGFRRIASQTPGRIGMRVAYDEGLAHRIEAGADIFLMPSRFEPCGLNQMYSQRYGTIPVVRRVGGLADTVIDATEAALANGSATGVVFNDADTGGILYGVRRALELLRDDATKRALQRVGMQRDYAWRSAAQQYLDLYRKQDERLPATSAQ